MPRLPRQFYESSTLRVAPELLGHFLVRKVKSQRSKVKRTIKTIITEVEAYVGEGDPACHAARGRTERNKVMYGRAGHAYIYFIYGMYHCLNVVTEKSGFPAAVLVRGVVPIKSKVKNQKSKVFHRPLDGPGKLCRELKITKKLNGADLVLGRELWIEKNPDRRFFLRHHKIKKTPRIGIREGLDKKWRWVVCPKKGVSLSRGK